MVANTATNTAVAKPATQPAKPAAVAVQVQPTRYIALLVNPLTGQPCATVNPKKPGSASAARFALYTQGCTVAAYSQAVVQAKQPRRLATADLLWDQRHGFISLHSTQAAALAAAQAATQPAKPAQ